MLDRKGPKSFEDLRNVEGVQYLTFHEAAIAAKLFASDEMFVGAMRDACAERPSLRRLQHYFAMVIYHGRPCDPQRLYEMFLDEMLPPASNGSYSRDYRMAEVSKNLEYYFNCMGTSFS